MSCVKTSEAPGQQSVARHRDNQPCQIKCDFHKVSIRPNAGRSVESVEYKSSTKKARKMAYSNLRHLTAIVEEYHRKMKAQLRPTSYMSRALVFRKDVVLEGRIGISLGDDITRTLLKCGELREKRLALRLSWCVEQNFNDPARITAVTDIDRDRRTARETHECGYKPGSQHC